MVSRRKLVVGLFIISLTILTKAAIYSHAYDDVQGVEMNDIIDIAFDRTIDGHPESGYDEENPFRLTVNPDYINIAFVNEIIGMKIGETKPSIQWTVYQENGTVTEIEYLNTKIVRLVKDATPSSTPIGEIILNVFVALLVVGGLVGAFFLYTKIIQPRFLTKKCMKCGNKATSKCSKCGSFVCAECLIKGCPSCGSKKYIRL